MLPSVSEWDATGKETDFDDPFQKTKIVLPVVFMHTAKQGQPHEICSKEKIATGVLLKSDI